MATYQTFWATHTGNAREQLFSFENPGLRAYNLCPCCQNSWKCDFKNMKYIQKTKQKNKHIICVLVAGIPENVITAKWIIWKYINTNTNTKVAKIPKMNRICVRNFENKKVTRSQCCIQTTPTKMATTTTKMVTTTITTLKTRKQWKQHY